MDMTGSKVNQSMSVHVQTLPETRVIETQTDLPPEPIREVPKVEEKPLVEEKKAP